MEKPNSIATRRVAVQYVIGAVDGADADDEPDFIPARGVVEFTASVAYTPYPVVSGPNPMTVLNAKITGVLDSEGYLCTPDPANPTLPGKRGVRLVCTDNADGSVGNWTWTAAPKFVDANGTRIPDVIPAFSFYLPADPDPNAPDLDLTTVVKVPASQGIGNAQAEALASLASAAAASSADSAETAVAAALDVKRRADAGEFKGEPGKDGVVSPAVVAEVLSEDPAIKLQFASATQKSDSWETAWRSWDTGALRDWYRANTGPRIAIDWDNPLRGVITVATQAQADALRGRLIVGGIKVVAPSLELCDFVVQGVPETHILIDVSNGGTPKPVKINIHHIEADGNHIADIAGVHGPSYAQEASGGTLVSYSHIHGVSDGIFAGGGGRHEYNWLHDFYDHDPLSMGRAWVDATDPHSDAFQIVSGKYVTIRRNFVENIAPGDNNISAIIYNTSSGAITDALLEENYIAGGGFSIRLLDQGKGFPDVRIKGNKFGGGYNNGLWNVDKFVDGTITDNYWIDTREPIPLVTGNIDGHDLLSAEDPFRFGYAATHMGVITGNQVWPTAGAARYMRVLSPAKVRRISMQVVVQSGNICVGVYRPVGGGMSSRPGRLVATSGIVPCPGTGLQRISLNATVDVRVGDFLALSCDNTTASFHGVSGYTSLLGAYQYAGSEGSFPLATNPTVANQSSKVPVLAGHM